jgi:excisionase family DNA binding protein
MAITEDALFLKVEDAADRLSLGRAKTWQLVMSGEIPSLTIGRSRRIPAAALREWVERRQADDAA